MPQKPSKYLTAIERQLLGISILSKLAGVDSLDLGIRNISTGSFQNFLNCRTDNDIGSALSACRARNAKDHDVYFRPARGLPASVVIIDDLNLPVASGLAEGKSHLLIETSPANYQLWLKTDMPLSEVDRKAVQTQIIKLHGGDIASTSGEHYGRLPGFKNRKQKYNEPWVNIKSFDIDGAPLNILSLMISPAEEQYRSRPMGACALVIQQPSSQHSVNNGDSHESHKEYKFACESARRRVDPENVIKRIKARALRRGKRNTDAAAEKYARLTVERAYIDVSQNG